MWRSGVQIPPEASELKNNLFSFSYIIKGVIVDRSMVIVLIVIAVGVIALIGLNRTGMFINPVGQTLGAACGNGICEHGETKCSCSGDCGYCDVYVGSCKRSYCSGDECLIETLSDCCGNKKCEIGECGSCLRDCNTNECGVFSVNALEDAISKGGTIQGNSINFDLGRLFTSSYFIFSIKSYDKDVKDLDVVSSCCLKINQSYCKPVSSKSIYSYFFNPENAVLNKETNSDKVLTLNSYGSVNYLFGFSFFDNSFIPRSEMNELIPGRYYAHCDLAFQSSSPEYLMIKSYDISFRVY